MGKLSLLVKESPAVGSQFLNAFLYQTQHIIWFLKTFISHVSGLWPALQPKLCSLPLHAIHKLSFSLCVCECFGLSLINSGVHTDQVYCVHTAQGSHSGVNDALVHLHLHSFIHNTQTTLLRLLFDVENHISHFLSALRDFWA